MVIISYCDLYCHGNESRTYLLINRHRKTSKNNSLNLHIIYSTGQKIPATQALFVPGICAGLHMFFLEAQMREERMI